MKIMKKLLSAVILPALFTCAPTNAAMFAKGWGTNLNMIFSSIRIACETVVGTGWLIFGIGGGNEEVRNAGLCLNGLALADLLLSSRAYDEKKDADQKNEILKEQNDRNMQQVGAGLYNSMLIYER